METDTDALGRKALTDILRKTAGLKASFTSNLVNNKKSPSLDLALRIEELTGIPPQFWKSENRGAAMWARVQKEQSR